MAKKVVLNISERIVLLRIIDVIFIVLGFLFANTYLGLTYLNLIHISKLIYLIVLLSYFLIIGQVFELYRIRDTASRFKTTKNLFVTIIVTVLAYLYTPIITPVLPDNRIEILTFGFTLFTSVFLWRNIYIYTIANKHFYKKIFLIGGDEDRLDDLINHIETYSRDHLITGYIAEKEAPIYHKYFNLDNIDLDKLIREQQVQQLVVSLRGFSDDSLKILNQKLVHYFEKGIDIIGFEDYLERITYCVPKQSLNRHFYTYFNFSENHENKLYLFIVRIGDIFCALIGLSFLLLVLPIVIIGNLICSRGALFYKQSRVGLNGEKFKIVKLRSMVTNAEKHGAQWAKKNDDRITKFGYILRKSRLDEIPQFWNVLKGEMSLIGPRPERPEFVTQLKEQIPLYSIRHVIKPGLTGWAQVMYPYAATAEEQEDKLRYDLYYIKKRGLFLDFKIVIKTINTVLYFKGQ